MQQPHKLFLLLTLVILLLLCAVIWFYPPTGDFRVENPFWNGLQTISTQTSASMLTSLNNLPTQQQGTVLLVIPYADFTQTELAKTQEYVLSGGTLLLLDDYGHGNQVLAGIYSSIRFSGQPLFDPLFNYKNEQLPKITDFTATPFCTNISSIIFNHATALTAPNATVVAYSSSFSFLDKNNNQIHDTDEPTGPFPVIAYQKIGQGTVVAVADPSVFINGMINLDDNQQFFNNLANIQANNPQIYIDQSHLPNASLDQAKAGLAIIYGAAATPIGTITLVAILFTVPFYPIWRRKKQ